MKKITKFMFYRIHAHAHSDDYDTWLDLRHKLWLGVYGVTRAEDA